ncbi:Composite domain of metallo-dependent hydrolase [Balamuthia mandrillaris]
MEDEDSGATTRVGGGGEDWSGLSSSSSSPSSTSPRLSSKLHHSHERRSNLSSTAPPPPSSSHLHPHLWSTLPPTRRTTEDYLHNDLVGDDIVEVEFDDGDEFLSSRGMATKRMNRKGGGSGNNNVRSLLASPKVMVPLVGCLFLVLVSVFVGLVSLGRRSGTFQELSLQAQRYCVAKHSYYLHNVKPHLVVGEEVDDLSMKQQRRRQTDESIVLRNVIIWTGDSSASPLRNYSLRIESGIISDILPMEKMDRRANDVVLDMQGRIVTPGLVDMHSHAGVYSWPENVKATEDGNEMTHPVTPQVRVIDAFDPEDPAIPVMRAAGITTIQVLPGSGNTMGGEAAHMKLLGSTIQDMLIPDAPRALKMACGENPKRVYGNKDKMPMSRMGSAWVMREKLFAAKQLMEKQDRWCLHEYESKDPEPYPEDLSLNPLVDLLRGNVRLNVHCYQVQDLEMMVRLAAEFSFNISAFHHGLEAYKVPHVLKSEDHNITAATFSDHWGYKMEAYDASVHAPKILYEAGVPLAIKTDHPVINAQDLMYEAAKAHHYGLPEQAALASVTSVPARAIGLDHRIGLIREGYDADLVVWDRYPLSLGAKPDLVFIDGVKVVDNNNTRPAAAKKSMEAPPKKNSSFQCPANVGRSVDSSLFVIAGVDVYTMSENDELLKNVKIVVREGNIECIGSSCEVPSSALVMNITGGGVAIPGLIESSAPIGLSEIESEEAASDGEAKGTMDELSEIEAQDGVRLYGRHVSAQLAAGITASIVAPTTTNSLVLGQGVAFNNFGRLIDDALIRSSVGLHINVGQTAKETNSLTGSISGQIAALRIAFAAALQQNEEAKNETTRRESAWQKVVGGKMPLVVHTQQVDVISAMLRLKNEFGFEMIVVGGAEAHVLAPRLALENVPVVLAPPRCVPERFFDQQQCSTDGVKRLVDAGVKTGLAVPDLSNARNLRWEAGLAKETGLTTREALATVTSAIADIFGLGGGHGRIKQGTVAELVVFDDDPLSLHSHPLLVIVGHHLECRPQQL